MVELLSYTIFAFIFGQYLFYFWVVLCYIFGDIWLFLGSIFEFSYTILLHLFLGSIYFIFGQYLFYFWVVLGLFLGSIFELNFFSSFFICFPIFLLSLLFSSLFVLFIFSSFFSHFLSSLFSVIINEF